MRSSRSSWIHLALVALAGPAAAQSTWYVDDNACPGPGSGTQVHPFCRIQDGIVAAAGGDAVLVWPGTYVERLDLLGKAIVVRSDADGDPATHDPDPLATVVDGSHEGSVVSFVSGEGPMTVLEGFTLTHGDALHGGGILCTGSSPTIVGNVIAENWGGDGGGVHLEGGAPSLQMNVIRDNDSSTGGGINAEFCAPSIVGNVIRGNESFEGSALVLFTASGVFSGNTVTGNRALSHATIALYYGTTTTIEHNTISDNDAAYGGAMAVWIDCAPLIANNVMAGNRVMSFGGAILCGTDSAPVIVGNTLVGNEAVFYGGGVDCYASSSAVIRGTILYGNTASTQQQIAGSPVVTYSNVMGGFPGTGNIDLEPGFSDPKAGDFALQADSPCVDAGDPADDPGGVDAGGAPRVLDGDLDLVRRIDMGAREFDNVHLSVTGAPTPGGTLVLDTTGTPGLAVFLLVGTGAGELSHGLYGSFFVDPQSPWWFLPWGSIPSAVSVNLAPDLPAPLPVFLQELALDPVSLAGNASNPVALLIQ